MASGIDLNTLRDASTARFANAVTSNLE